jgi:hypothetical protein
MYGFQAVADIRQGALGDRRQGIGEIAPRKSVVQRFIKDSATVIGRWRRYAFMG